MKYDVYQGLFIWPQKKTLNLGQRIFLVGKLSFKRIA